MAKKTFINFELGGPISLKLFLRHLLYSLIWIVGIGIIIFRSDFILLKIIPENTTWLIPIIPFVFILFVIITMFKSKWYYNVSMIFYPLLVVFWFLPKAILRNGKIYLFFGYIDFIFNRIKQYKKTITHLSIIILIIFLLLATNSNAIIIVGMLYFTFLYYLIVVKYVLQSLQPAKLFGANVDKKIDDLIKKPEKSYFFVNSITDYRGDDKLEEEESKLKKVERLIIAKTIIEHFASNLNGSRGKRAFVISWAYQFIGFIMLTIAYFTFLNYELYVIDASNFSTTINPEVFDFLYYTMKTFIFSNIESIIPVSTIAKIIEITSFLTVGVFVLIIVTSIIFSLRQERINDNIKKATEFCTVQNNFIVKQVEVQYQMSVESVLLDMKTIKQSVDNIKNVIEKIL
ncbi:MAG: hypothetical protein KAU44_02775 [Candidatus Marinimicrobia bacterium]|nr:hypothetical protein [Candidatus Neomarinimicrobiota bacterium]